MTEIAAAVVFGMICYFVWRSANRMKKRSDIIPPDFDLSDIGKPDALSVAEPKEIPKANVGGNFLIAGLGIAAVLWLAFSVAIALFVLTLIYGVIVIIFRMAFGVELPHPPWL